MREDCADLILDGPYSLFWVRQSEGFWIPFVLGFVFYLFDTWEEFQFNFFIYIVFISY